MRVKPRRSSLDFANSVGATETRTRELRDPNSESGATRDVSQSTRESHPQVQRR